MRDRIEPEHDAISDVLDAMLRRDVSARTEMERVMADVDRKPDAPALPAVMDKAERERLRASNRDPADKALFERIEAQAQRMCEVMAQQLKSAIGKARSRDWKGSQAVWDERETRDLRRLWLMGSPYLLWDYDFLARTYDPMAPRHY